VGNAFQTANYLTTRFGFKHIAYRGLETGSRDLVTHVVSQGQITIACTSSLYPQHADHSSFLAQHGDAVRVIALTVLDCRAVFARALEHGARVVREPSEARDEFGHVITAEIATFGDVIHRFVERKDYTGPFMPGHVASEDNNDPLQLFTPCPGLHTIDHVVGNQHEGELNSWVTWYNQVLALHTLSEYTVNTGESSLRTVIVSSANEAIKMPLIEPLQNVKKSQNQEYVDFNGGAGVQHIAFHTADIIHAVTQLRARGVRFQEVPPQYYSYIRRKLENSRVVLKEDLQRLEELKILIDFDEHSTEAEPGYLLQIFTHLIQDRPTVFFELIQRHKHQGFGEGNIKALFECVEREQERRGNLTADHRE
jgi:4-hydroxyphenylpyruvate dioxygenase